MMAPLFRFFLFSFFAYYSSLAWSQVRPENGIAPSESKSIAITHVDVYVNPTQKIENATLLIHDGKIQEVGVELPIPDNYVVLDRTGYTILPAFIELYSDAGTIKATSNFHSSSPQLNTSKSGDYYWNESIHPEISAIEGFNFKDSRLVDLQKQGFGFVVPHQADGIVRGSAPLISLGDLSTNLATLSLESAMFFSFQKGVSQQSYPSSLMGSMALLRQSLYDLKYFKFHPDSDLGKLSMEAWRQKEIYPAFFKVSDKWDIQRAQNISNEFKYPFIYITQGDEYAIKEDLMKLNARLVVPIKFPLAFDVSDPYVAKNVNLGDLKHWELAPYNFKLLSETGIPCAITSHGLSTNDFWPSLRKLISKGTQPNQILAALTTIPASYLNKDSILGTLERGKWASFGVYSNDPLHYESVLVESWNLGKKEVINSINEINILGMYSLNIKSNRFELNITGSAKKPTAKIVEFKDIWDKKLKVFKKDSVVIAGSFVQTNQDVTLQFSLPSAPNEMYLLHGKVSSNGSVWEGDITYPDGSWGQWSAIRRFKVKDTTKAIVIEKEALPSSWYPNMAYGSVQPLGPTHVVFEEVTIWTNENAGIISKGYVVVQNGKITYVGEKKPPYPTGAIVYRGENLHLTSGIIDEHSHIAISRGVNEGGQVVSAEVSIGDVVYPEDISIYRQLAGGVTAAQLLHGSANVIGGQSALIKLKWGLSPEKMKIENAPGFIKCALGENVKQSNWGDRSVVRFPQTRMGVEQVFYDAFYRAKAYKKEWDSIASLIPNVPPNKMPRVDLELETLNEILDGSRFITCHSYVQSEINMLMKVADSMGFKINTFTHILEGYKVADKMKEHGVGGSTFSDWWAYKFEVNEAIPYNAALMQKQGVVVAINSDDAEMGRRLNQEAAKTIKYGGLSEVEAWKTVTLNPAILLHLDHRMGSVKVGKDADLVLWTTNPLSIEAKASVTMIEGVVYYSIAEDEKLQNQNRIEKMRLISKMLSKDIQEEPKQPFFKRKKKHFHCDTLGEEASDSENLH